MNITIMKLLFLFFSGSLFGWIFELFFRRIFSQKKWVNPGFLTGPYLPIYGFGLVIMYVLSELMVDITSNQILNNCIIIFSMGALLTLIEFVAGKIFILGMHIKLWDYSDRWKNVQGIICPLFSLLWTFFGTIYYFFVNPYIKKSLEWLTNNLVFSFFIGFFFGLLLVDLWNALNIGTKLRTYAKENNIVIKYENLKVYVTNRKKELKEKISYVFPFRAIESFKLEIENYILKDKENDNLKILKKIKKKDVDKK